MTACYRLLPSVPGGEPVYRRTECLVNARHGMLRCLRNRCQQRLNVTSMTEWPSRSLATFGCIPWATGAAFTPGPRNLLGNPARTWNVLSNDATILPYAGVRACGRAWR